MYDRFVRWRRDGTRDRLLAVVQTKSDAVAIPESTMNFAIRQTPLLWLPLLVPIGTGGAPPRAATAQAPTPTGGPPPQPIPYPAGWNLLSVTQAGSGIPVNVSLYTLAPGGMAYEAVAPTDTKPGIGYWAYFPTDNRVLLVPQTLCQQCGVPFPPLPCHLASGR